MQVKLSKRMSALAKLVTPGNRLADIGCDHGYLPIFLCQSGLIPGAIAMDVNEGPMARARKHINAYGLADRIKTRRSDGIAALQENEAESVLIAGMGGMLTVRILTKDTLPESVTELILQPQSDIAAVRGFIGTTSFHIVCEDMVEEDGKYYPMLKARRDAVDADSFVKEIPEDVADAFGPYLLSVRHPILLKWLKKEKEKTEALLVHVQTEALREKLRLLLSALSLYESEE